jgi:hypothetical protein
MRVSRILILGILLSGCASSVWPPYSDEALSHFKRNSRYLYALANQISSDDLVQVESILGQVYGRRSIENGMEAVDDELSKKYIDKFREDEGIFEVSTYDDMVSVYVSHNDRFIDGYRYRWKYAMYPSDREIEECPNEVSVSCGECAIRMDDAWHLEYRWWYIGEGGDPICK